MCQLSTKSKANPRPSAAEAVLRWYRPTLHSLKWGTRQITRALEIPSSDHLGDGLLQQGVPMQHADVHRKSAGLLELPRRTTGDIR